MRFESVNQRRLSEHGRCQWTVKDRRLAVTYGGFTPTTLVLLFPTPAQQCVSPPLAKYHCVVAGTVCEQQKMSGYPEFEKIQFLRPTDLL